MLPRHLVNMRAPREQHIQDARVAALRAEVHQAWSNRLLPPPRLLLLLLGDVSVKEVADSADVSECNGEMQRGEAAGICRMETRSHTDQGADDSRMSHGCREVQRCLPSLPRPGGKARSGLKQRRDHAKVSPLGREVYRFTPVRRCQHPDRRPQAEEMLHHLRVSTHRCEVQSLGRPPTVLLLGIGRVHTGRAGCTAEQADHGQVAVQCRDVRWRKPLCISHVQVCPLG